MTTISVYEAKTQLSKLLRRVEAGEEVIIARDGQPVARLVGLAAAPSEPRAYGAGEGKIWFADDFDAPDLDAAERPLEPPTRQRRKRKR